MINKKYAKRFCREAISKIENYEKAITDTTQTWECHHRDEVKILPSGIEVRRSREELIENGRYYNCPANELIFLTKEAHRRLHHKGKHLSEESKIKLSESKKSDFGNKFFEHFGFTNSENQKLYNKERMWYQRHNKTCRWEVQ